MTAPPAPQPFLLQMEKLREEQLSGKVISETTAVIRHNVVMALAGRRHPPQGVSTDSWPEGLPKGSSATRLIDGAVVPAEHAIITNSLLMGARAQHDEVPAPVSHFGSTVIPALLAVAEQQQSSGMDFVRALALGYEVGDRIGRAVVSDITVRGFRPTGLFGPIASAAAVGDLLGLNRDEWVSAVALACNMSAGLAETWRAGTDEWKYQTALAARSGYTAATLAHSGVKGSPSTLEAPHGLFRAFAQRTVHHGDGHPSSAQLATLPSEGWAVGTVNLKLYPVCVFNQAAVQQTIQLRNVVLENPEIQASEISRITVRMNPENVDYPGVNVHHPAPSRAARLMSLPLCVAFAAVNGAIDVDDLEAPVPGPVQQLAHQVSVVPDNSISSHYAHVTLHTDTRELASKEVRGLQVDETQAVAVYQSLQPHTGHSAEEFEAILSTLSSLASVDDMTTVIRGFLTSSAAA